MHTPPQSHSPQLRSLAEYQADLDRQREFIIMPLVFVDGVAGFGLYRRHSVNRPPHPDGLVAWTRVREDAVAIGHTFHGTLYDTLPGE